MSAQFVARLDKPTMGDDGHHARDRSKEVAHLNRVATTGAMSASRRSRDRDAGDLNNGEALHIMGACL